MKECPCFRKEKNWQTGHFYCQLLQPFMREKCKPRIFLKIQERFPPTKTSPEWDRPGIAADLLKYLRNRTDYSRIHNVIVMMPIGVFQKRP
jgi:hypothetical protein